jgi:hypothetical protein
MDILTAKFKQTMPRWKQEQSYYYNPSLIEGIPLVHLMFSCDKCAPSMIVASLVDLSTKVPNFENAPCNFDAPLILRPSVIIS